MREESFLVKIWNVLWPLAIYMVVQNMIAILGSFVLMIISSLVNADAQGMVNLETITAGTMDLYEQYAIVFILIAALICIPIYHKMYKKDCMLAGEMKKDIPISNKDIFAIAVSSAALALAMNNMISLTPLPRIFKGYEDTNAVLYGGGFILQVITAGIFACIVEELSMRGITYLRMKRYWGTKTAMLLSALVFGLYHLNVVQAVYSFFLGLFFAWLYERYDSMWAPCIAHMSANLFIILLSKSSIFEKTVTTLVGFCLITCIASMIFFYGWKWMKQSSPEIKLEFVEKEPDTLEKLREEYRGQEREGE